MTTRGYAEKDFELVAQIIVEALTNRDNAEKLAALKQEVHNLNLKHPLPSK